MTDDDVPTLIATELRSISSHAVATKKVRSATRETCRPKSHGRQSLVKPDFEPRRGRYRDPITNQFTCHPTRV